MNRSTLPTLFGAAVLLVASTGCRDAAEEAPAAGEAVVVEAPAAAPATADAPASGALLDPNAATREELLAIEHVDEPLADAIVAGRPYADMLAVDRVLAPRLTGEQRDAVYGRLWKPIDVNAATEEEILLIPGVGSRMQHEFEEYRPYQSIAQFRREIGKYVDDEELARLERYVEVR